MSTDLFDLIPEAPRMTDEQRQAIEDKARVGKKIKAEGEGYKDKAKTPNYAAIARKHWRDAGYIVGQAQTVATHYVGGQSHVTTKDLFGIVDFVALGRDGEVVFVQATSKGGKSAHVKKMLTESFKIGNGTPTPIVECVSRLAAGPARFVLHCPFHDGPGAPWQHDITEVTPELLDTWQAKRERRSA